MKKGLRLTLVVLITVTLTLIIVLPFLMVEFHGGSAMKEARGLFDHNEISKEVYVDSGVDTNGLIIDENSL